VIIRVFPRRTSFTPCDELAFVGDPPMIRPEADEVHVSCTFTWDKPRAGYLAKAWGQYYPVKLGGVAYDNPCNGFVSGMYVKRGVVFTSRGCDNQCPWCLVWKREGKLRTIPIVEGNLIQDNNFLQCNRDHQDRVFDMLTNQRSVEFSGGLDARLLTDGISERMRSLRIKQVFLACDTKESIKPLRKALQILKLPQQKVRCYALLKFNPNETISEATERMIEIWNAGAMPFAQLFQPSTKLIQYSKEWRDFQRTWQRPAAMKSYMKYFERGNK
jgi:hypothetical protein